MLIFTGSTTPAAPFEGYRSVRKPGVHPAEVEIIHKYTDRARAGINMVINRFYHENYDAA